VQKPDAEPTTDVKTPHAKIGELTLRTKIFARRARQDGSAADAQPWHVAHGASLRGLPAPDRGKAGRLHVAALMARMDIEAPHRKLGTSKPAPGHKIRRHLLRKLPINRPNPVSLSRRRMRCHPAARWTSPAPPPLGKGSHSPARRPMARGFIHLVAAFNRFIRRGPSWCVSIMLEADFCIETAEEALAAAMACPKTSKPITLRAPRASLCGVTGRPVCPPPISSMCCPRVTSRTAYLLVFQLITTKNRPK
jgi:hypothetical protein